MRRHSLRKPSPARSAPSFFVRLLCDRRGAAGLEYVIVFATVGLTIVAAVAAVAPGAVHRYSTERALLYRHEP